MSESEITDSDYCDSSYDPIVSTSKSNSSSNTLQSSILRKRIRKMETKHKKLCIRNSEKLLVDQQINEFENVISAKSKSAIQKITENFSKTYKDIKDHPSLKVFPLEGLDRDIIANFIRVQRQKSKRNITSQMQKIHGDADSLICRPSLEIQDKYMISNKGDHTFARRGCDQQHSAYLCTAQYIFGSFNELAKDVQNKLLGSLCELMIKDAGLCQALFESHLNHKHKQLLQLFLERDVQNIQLQLKGFSSIQVIKIHLLACQQVKLLQHEGSTLYSTLYPYLHQVIDLKQFEKDDSIYIDSMIRALVRHLLDANENLSIGIVGLLVELNSFQSLRALRSGQITNEFQQYLIKSGFTEVESLSITSSMENFLYPSFIGELKKVNLVYRQDLISLLSKCKVLQDPTGSISELNIKEFEVDRIDLIFSLPESMWMTEVSKLQSAQINIVDRHKMDQKVQQVYDHYTNAISEDQRVLPEDTNYYSQMMEKVCEEYKHSPYQSIIAAIVLSQDSSVVQVQMPTASGKTWVQGIIACYWISKGKKVLIIVPDQLIKQQSQRFLQPLGIQLQVETIQEFYKSKMQHDIIIVDEFDKITKSNSFYCYDGKIYGLWDLALTQTYLFSATCEVGITRILGQVCIKPLIVKFQSEYELINEVDQDQGGDIETCLNKEERLGKLVCEVTMIYQSQPVIIFCDEREQDRIFKKLSELKDVKIFRDVSIKILDEIQSQSTGILILKQSDCYGYNTKFMVDAKVLIACEVQSESQYQQMRGRSSRSMGSFNSIYYPIANMLKSQILYQMKKASIKELDELEQLVRVVYQKRHCKSIVEAISAAIEAKDSITSLEDLKQNMDTASYKKIMATVK